MKILWDCRSVRHHRGGIGRAAAGWLEAFLQQLPDGWEVDVLFSTACDPDEACRIIPGVRERAAAISVKAGMVAPRFEQLALPGIIAGRGADLYFNPSFTLPAIKTCRFQCSVVHDVVFLDHPGWVDDRLRRYLEIGADLSLRKADAVFTVSEYSRSRIRSLARVRRWDRAAGVGLVRPAISSELLRVASGARRETSAAGPAEGL